MSTGAEPGRGRPVAGSAGPSSNCNQAAAAGLALEFKLEFESEVAIGAPVGVGLGAGTAAAAAVVVAGLLQSAKKLIEACALGRAALASEALAGAAAASAMAVGAGAAALPRVHHVAAGVAAGPGAGAGAALEAGVTVGRLGSRRDRIGRRRPWVAWMYIGDMGAVPAVQLAPWRVIVTVTAKGGWAGGWWREGGRQGKRRYGCFTSG